ncbi:hypothetical protein [Gimesia alba]|uniref:hypothetical protein n=1 Tax=Gimesia alba TaxID=2527973 RepID=UPI0011A6EE7C
MSRARYRGRAKVQIQAYLTATAQNLKRLVKAFCFLLFARWSLRRMIATHSLHIPRMRVFSTRPTVFACANVESKADRLSDLYRFAVVPFRGNSA